MSGEVLRLFVALGLPDAAADGLEAFARRAADAAMWRLLAREDLHLTLAFLGATPAEAVGEIAEVLARSAGAAPELVLGPALLLPPRRPRTLGASVSEPEGKVLAALQGAVAGGLAARGLHEPEARPFRAHVTVARLRPRARAPRKVSEDPEPVAFAARELLLMSSRLHPSGARYEPLARIALG